MAFGLCIAPSAFQSIMNHVFRPYLRKFILIFFNDNLVYSRNWDDHLGHLRMVLEILHQNQFVIKHSECFFRVREVEYLGHFISEKGVRVDPCKIELVVKWPIPTNVTELRGFLGFSGYYEKFCPKFGEKPKVLHQLTKKNQFKWSEGAQQAFDELKKAMSSTPVLALPNFNEEFAIEIDVSGYGIGAVLSQNGRPIAYLSKGIAESKRSWSIYEKEMLEYWRQFVIRDPI